MERKPGSSPITQTQPTLGVIEAISAGLDAVLRHPWLLLIPVLLDVFLWVGPRLHAPALYQAFEPTLSQMTTQMTTSEARYAIQELGKAINQFFTQFNLLAWLSAVLVGVPVVNGGIDATANLVTGSAPLMWLVDGFEGYLLIFVSLTVIGLFISALYWTLLGDYVRGETFQTTRWLQRSFEVWKKLLVLALIVVGLVVMSIFPLSMVMFTLSAFGGELVSLVPLLVLGVAAWIVLVCIFTPHGLVVHHMPLGRAVNTSIVIVRTNFAPVASLVVIAIAISIGMGLIWDALAADSWLRLIAIAGNAIIGTGLIVASLLFYRNRVAILFESHHWPLPAGR
ncbi:MAG TPA: hypothetical protein VMP08_11295 [Anaerolineae bacterium]|nr:hypothetical protein [Anaerolineae bacterium]